MTENRQASSIMVGVRMSEVLNIVQQIQKPRLVDA